MYRILIADDEGLMVESLRTMILRNFPDECEVTTARSGRVAIEQAEVVHPDIIFMDIQMPGINGIDALKEIRKNNTTALFYIISAYDKFDYAQEAISLNVEKYLMKPITKKVIIQTVTEAMEKVSEMRRSRSHQLKVQEKLETVLPVVETGFLGMMLTQGDEAGLENYRALLDITEDHLYVCVYQFGTAYEDGKLVTPVGAGVRAQGFYSELRAVIKSFRRCFVSGILSDRVAVAVPCEKNRIDYEDRVAIIEECRKIVARLEENLHMNFRAGIGRVREIHELRISYQEALQALRESDSHVVHTNDIVARGFYEGGFPDDIEKKLFAALGRGDLVSMQTEANRFFDWMLAKHPEEQDNIRLKVLEYVLWAERDAFAEGAVNYGFESRRGYLTEVCAIGDYNGLRDWFLEKMSSTCRAIATRREEQSESVVTKARAYIDRNYHRDISLDDVSREVNVSPYYFSKLFKEESGETFIEYLTGLRIETARKLLLQDELTIKEISAAVGYSDPNYFSRIFKKQTELTPREFREKRGELI